MISIVVYIKVDEFSVNFCIVFFCVFVFFKYQYIGIIVQYEVIMFFILWVVCCLWVIIVGR